MLSTTTPNLRRFKPFLHRELERLYCAAGEPGNTCNLNWMRLNENGFPQLIDRLKSDIINDEAI